MDQSLLVIAWYYDQTDPENPQYCLRYQGDDPQYHFLDAQIAASEVTERAARARLIERVFNNANDAGLDASRLRFHV